MINKRYHTIFIGLLLLVMIGSVQAAISTMPFRYTRKAKYARDKHSKDVTSTTAHKSYGAALLREDLAAIDAALEKETQIMLIEQNAAAARSNTAADTEYTKKLTEHDDDSYDAESIMLLRDAMAELEEDFQLFIQSVGGDDLTSRPCSTGASTDSDDETASADVSRISATGSELSLYAARDSDLFEKTIIRLKAIEAHVRRTIQSCTEHIDKKYAEKIDKHMQILTADVSNDVATMSDLIVVVRKVYARINMLAFIIRAAHRNYEAAAPQQVPVQTVVSDLEPAKPVTKSKHKKRKITPAQAEAINNAINELNDAGENLARRAGLAHQTIPQEPDIIECVLIAMVRNAAYAQQVLAENNLQGTDLNHIKQYFHKDAFTDLVTVLKQDFIKGDALISSLYRQADFIDMLADNLYTPRPHIEID
jgi:hypothetical protein